MYGKITITIVRWFQKWSMMSWWHGNAVRHDDVIKWKHFPRYWPFVRCFTGPGEFPAQRLVTRSFDVFFDLRPNKRLSKQWWGWWFEPPSSPLRRHCNVSLTFCGGNPPLTDSFHSNVEFWCFLHSWIQAVQQTVVLLVIWDCFRITWHRFNALGFRAP